MNDPKQSADRLSPWPHRWAWLLCCATFPLLWVGGLITTTDAGMAVPDWPGTYGYNLFLYPWGTWFFGPWDLFVEHGHRLLASGVGMLTIGLVVVVFRCDKRPWLRGLALAALGLVIWQGVLGGLRVVLNERLLALAHGATGPLFFALTAALVVLTGPPPADAEVRLARRNGWRGFALWGIVAVQVYLQVVLGATIRHVPEDSSFNSFALHVRVHLWGALLVTLVVAATAYVAVRRPVGRTRRWLAALMAVVVVAQLSLGVATWVAKYRLPDWANSTLDHGGVAADAWDAAVGPGTISPSTSGGWTETYVVTGHSATGSLLLALATAHAVVARRRSVHSLPVDPTS